MANPSFGGTGCHCSASVVTFDEMGDDTTFVCFVASFTDWAGPMSFAGLVQSDSLSFFSYTTTIRYTIELLHRI